MAEIKVGSGSVALIDDSDYAELSVFRWSRQRNKSDGFYAFRVAKDATGKLRKIYMHSVVMRARAGQRIDHINGNGLDNRRVNLRLCSNAENMRNMISRRGRSRFKGVSWFARDEKWRAYIVKDARQIHLGYFKSETEAAEAYDAAASRLFGEFARPNFGPVTQRERSLGGV